MVKKPLASEISNIDKLELLFANKQRFKTRNFELS